MLLSWSPLCLSVVSVEIAVDNSASLPVALVVSADIADCNSVSACFLSAISVEIRVLIVESADW